MRRKNATRSSSPKIGIIGGGSWATALVKVLTDNNHRVRWWIRNPESINYIKSFNRNPKYLSSVELNLGRAKVSNNLRRIIRVSDVLLVAVPSAFVKGVFEKANKRVLRKKLIISAIKGLIPEDNYILSEYFARQFELPETRYMVVGGPCHAEEIAQEKLSYLTIAGQQLSKVRQIAALFNNRYVKTTLSDDITGIEYAEALKNIIAIAAGICRGCGFGDNFQAVLISNAIREVEGFLLHLNKSERNINQTVYVGDLLVTSYSQYSRNRTFGHMIGKGYSVKSAQLEMQMVAEGYYAAKSIHEINQHHKVEMPIVEAVYNILYQKIAPMMEMKVLSEKLT